MNVQGLETLSRRAASIGIAGIVLALIAALTDPEHFWPSYLFGYLFWLGISIGSAGLVMLHHLTGGRWGIPIRRILEAGARTIFLMAALFVPLFFGLSHLYEWTHAEVVAADEVLRHKSRYLNVPFFSLRAVLYFVVWIALAYLVTKWSYEQDRTGEPTLGNRMRALSGPGLVLYGGAITFAAVDWVMSLEPHWYSTIYGIKFILGQVLTAFAAAILIAAWLSRARPLSELATSDVFHDLGNLLLAFVMLWAYVAFSQFLIIWSGNLPEEIPWYLRRMRGHWEVVAGLLIVFHFLIPFLLLLSRAMKRNVRTLAILAGMILIMRVVDLYWIVMPAFEEKGIGVHWSNAAVFLGIGGFWLAFWAREVKRHELIPIHDPRILEVRAAYE
ncbi:MAG: hypothetical protein N0A16_09445 [Blastocatellia bacterium]|nr:hypothetical protein [Blastocatellia bacterium]MCS7157937.1 hypothetical protein [Blastocatellia bacterium]MCX7752444.1 hypothetical protein [Blastocatellia bacterium]MDW8167441.1 hypothetical protein [Acidobacteriota bacterium]MDW8257381.1 hypothetical protein [Acidobacteriota bacterium]